jgi:hypothetical protein
MAGHWHRGNTMNCREVMDTLRSSNCGIPWPGNVPAGFTWGQDRVQADFT